MVDESAPHTRVRTDGKFFRLGQQKFHLRGICYGPFGTDADLSGVPSPEQVRSDFEQLLALGANLLRVYQVPPRWLLDLALECQLRLLIDLPWAHDRCFLDSRQSQREVRAVVREAARACAAHPAVCAFSVAREIPPEIVRWSGPSAVERFLEILADEARSIDPECLCTFLNSPATECLQPRNLDFICFQVEGAEGRAFEDYLTRLQSVAGGKPLVLGELHTDASSGGDTAGADGLAWRIEAAFRGGLAGAIAYRYTDAGFEPESLTGAGGPGLTTAEREPKPGCFALEQTFQAVPYFPLERYPMVSVVVAARNAGPTLAGCLDSLTRLNYPDYEIILVDDGSTDDTPEIASRFETVGYSRQQSMGLSMARNTGIAVAQGEIVAFIDADCHADEDWLYYLVGDLLRGGQAGVGGHCLPSRGNPAVSAALRVLPGGRAPVLLSEREAEQIPGCNMAFWKSSLEEIGGFDPALRQAGEDVDLCWRLLRNGHGLGFSPAGLVRDSRASTVGAYLRRQESQGEADALLTRKYPECFDPFDGRVWRGHRHTPGRFGPVFQHPLGYQGRLATAAFPARQATDSVPGLIVCTSFEYHVLVTLPLVALSATLSFLLPVALASLALSLAVCVACAAQADIPRPQRRFWSRPLVALLFLLQPMVRGWARWQRRLTLHPLPKPARARLGFLCGQESPGPARERDYWGDTTMDRLEFVRLIQRRLDEIGWPAEVEDGWGDYDLEIFGHRWSRVQLTTVSEEGPDRRLFRCRLRSRWSRPALLGFWTAFAAEVFAIGILGHGRFWPWLVLLSMGVFGGLLHREARKLRRGFAAFLDETAAQEKMTRLCYDPARKTFVPAQPARSAAAPSVGSEVFVEQFGTQDEDDRHQDGTDEARASADDDLGAQPRSQPLTQAHDHARAVEHLLAGDEDPQRRGVAREVHQFGVRRGAREMETQPPHESHGPE